MTKTKNINPWNGKAASIQGGDEIFLLENKAVDVICDFLHLLHRCNFDVILATNKEQRVKT
jgi:hypothetical protein